MVMPAVPLPPFHSASSALLVVLAQNLYRTLVAISNHGVPLDTIISVLQDTDRSLGVCLVVDASTGPEG